MSAVTIIKLESGYVIENGDRISMGMMCEKHARSTWEQAIKKAEELIEKKPK